MTQKLIDLTFSEEQLRAIDGAIAVLEANLTGLIALGAVQRLSLQKMGSTGEPFCRNTLSALAQNPQIVPHSLGLPWAQADLRALDQLRPRGMRPKVLAGRVEDSEMALGSDVRVRARFPCRSSFRRSGFQPRALAPAGKGNRMGTSQSSGLETAATRKC